MSAFKGTPGPWEANESGGYVMVGGADGTGLFYESASHPGAIEDARLIAAAPELLSSLEFAVKLLSGLPHVGGTAQLEHMRSVIAKATGSAA